MFAFLFFTYWLVKLIKIKNERIKHNGNVISKDSAWNMKTVVIE